MREINEKSQNTATTPKIFIKFPEVLLILLVLILFIIILSPVILRKSLISYHMACGSNLSNLGKALMLYTDEHGAYPQPDKWCDALLQGNYATEKMFKCSGNKKARCSFSINPNCEPNSEPNTVLAFESKGGWNSYGGPELFTADHHNNEGGNILYNDGHVKFESTDANGHFDFELNWGEKNKGRDLK
jgi:prepilin-type processing-associated H-X9-DG protein